MSRSKWKSFFVDVEIINKIIYNDFNKHKKPIYTKSRNSTIIKYFVGQTFFVYKGNSYKKLIITNDMVGFKLGEFVFTRVIGKIHASKKKLNKIKKKI